MWKKEDVKPQGAIRETPPAPAPVPVPIASSTPAHSAPPAAVPLPVSPRAAACISQGIRIKGEVSGSEDLFVDGQVEGKLSLSNGSLTVGPNGSVKADLNAREVIVRGTVEGKVSGRDRVQLWSTGRVNGEVQTERLAIEEGAVLRGKVEAGKSTGRATESRAAAASASVSAKVAETKPIGSETAAD
jgi:cytoskeletal protein CcmA (bactofilin family)